MNEECAGGLSRRQLIAGALTAGGAALLAAQPAHAATETNDVALLTPALQAEQLTALAARHVLGLSGLTAHGRRTVRVVLEHARAHVRALERQIEALGGTPPSAPSAVAAVGQTLSKHGMSASFAGHPTAKQGIQILQDLQAVCEGALYHALSRLKSTPALVLSLQILASDAQHSALLAMVAYGEDPTLAIPNWYVAGVR